MLQKSAVKVHHESSTDFDRSICCKLNESGAVAGIGFLMYRLCNIIRTEQQQMHRSRLSAISRHLCSHTMAKINIPTVGIIIIGDEILKGHIQDTNSNFLCKKLFSLGVKVKRVSVIPDELDIIAKEVATFSREFTHVITAGGIGPTHDDLTFEGVAKAFNEPTHPHPDLVALCKEFFGTDDLKSPKLKLAFIPTSANLNYGVNKHTGEKQKFPLVNVRNVFVFPGVPQLMERAFDMLEEIFRNPNAQFHMREIYIKRDEASVAGVLNRIDEKFRDKVILGSYPDFYNSYYKVKLTVESEKAENVDEVCRYMEQEFAGSIVQYEKDPIGKAVDCVYGIVDSQDDGLFVNNVRHAVHTIEQALDQYTLEELCVGFNGGKDCTVLLHLVYAVFRKKHPNNFRKMQTLYIRRGQPFPELELFIKLASTNYRLSIISIYGRIKDALTELKTSHPHIKAVLMGTRRSDPHSDHLQTFSQTDEGWPDYMRISPILDWSYSDVWTFLRKLNLPYCSLYDRGYTSLGSMENTHPNPTLQQVDSRGIISYRPAFELPDGQSERAGRN